MADAYDAAKNETDQARRGLLAAIAQGGTAARQAYEQQQAQLQAQRAASLDQIARDSGVIGAPEAQLADLRRRIAGSYDTRIGALGDAAASRSAELAQQQAAGEAYLGKVDAALPVLKAQGDRQLAQLRADAEEKARDRDLQQMLAEMRLQGAAMDLEGKQASVATAKAKAAAPTTPAKVISNLGGVDATRNLIRQDAETAAADFSVRRGANGPGSAPTSAGSLANMAAVRLGLPDGYGAALTAQKPPAPPRPSQVLADANAQAELDARNRRLSLLETAKRAASPKTYFELEKAIVAGETDGMQAALDYVARLKDDYLKRNGISRAALTDWVRRYGAI